jgi:single-stranded DNA-binding protein
MLIGVVEGYRDMKDFTIILKVNRDFGKDSDTFEIKFFGALADMLKENISIGEKIVIKGRLVQTTKLELVGERVEFFKGI